VNVSDKPERLPKVILIGGPPMSGKTTVARKLSARLSYCCVLTDDIVQAMAAITTKDSHPALHPMAGHSYSEYYIARTVDELFNDALRRHEAAWPGIEEVIRAHANWGAPMVMEGWSLLPDKVAGLGLPNVASVFIILDAVTLEHRLRNESEFTEVASDKEAMIRKFVARSIRYGHLVEGVAESLRLPVVRPPRSAGPDRVFEMCWDALGMSKAGP